MKFFACVFFALFSIVAGFSLNEDRDLSKLKYRYGLSLREQLSRSGLDDQTALSRLRYNNISGPCSAPVLKNGKVRTRQRGNLARFQCNWSFELIGQRYAVCINGVWDTPVPMCIKSGCKNPTHPVNGVGLFSRKNAVVMFFCNPGFVLKGASKMYCDGRVWNDTTPTCEGENPQPVTSCDFEEADLCGWSPDPMHDFDWRRQKKSTPSGHIGTGPSYDHTKGYGKDGYYMYIESSSHVENDTARLLSPIYSQSLSTNGCFAFYYHMYGRTTGTLRILVYPILVELSAVVNSMDVRKRYTMFEKSGNQGNVWYRGFFELDEMDTDFQIVVEGVRGSGYVSDIAIDDVAILEFEKCAREKENIKIHMARDSCLNRCGKDIQEVDSAEVDCQCSSDCEDLNICCVDYRDLCIFDFISSTEGNIAQSTDITAEESYSTNSSEEAEREISTISTSTTTTTTGTTLRTTIPTTQTTAESTTITITKAPTTTTMRTTLTSTIRITTPTTTVPTTKATTKAVPYLIFNTKSPPMRNATGILSKWTSKPTKISSNVTSTNMTNSVNKPFTLRRSSTTVKLTKPSSTTRPTTSFSKAYIHYGKDEHGKDIENITKNSTTKNNIIGRSGEIVNFNQDAIVSEPESEDHSPISVTSIILIAATIFIGSCIIITAARTGTLTREIERVRSRFSSLGSTDGGSDIRFLVEEETLEHDLID